MSTKDYLNEKSEFKKFATTNVQPLKHLIQTQYSTRVKPDPHSLLSLLRHLWHSLPPKIDQKVPTEYLQFFLESQIAEPASAPLIFKTFCELNQAVQNAKSHPNDNHRLPSFFNCNKSCL
jgi:hypothetical protein